MIDTRTANALETEIQYVKGVGPKNAMLLGKLGLKTVSDLLWHFPRRYEDRRHIPPIMYLKPGQHSSLSGRLIDVRSRSIGKGRIVIHGVVSDKTGEANLTFFNQPFVGKLLQKSIGQDVFAYGLVREGYRHSLEIHNCEWETIEDNDSSELARLVPVYGLTEGIPQRVLRKAARAAVENYASVVLDPLPVDLRQDNDLPDLTWAIRQMHLPDSQEDQVRARQRLAFEEFLYLQIALQMRRQEVQREIGISFPISRIGTDLKEELSPQNLFSHEVESGEKLWDQVKRILPFDLTAAQKRVIHEIWSDMELPLPMNRLVQGDVGSGKTAVAACAMLACVRSGYQAALMAPTEILAEQHFLNLKRLFEPLGICLDLVSGKQTASQRKKKLQKLESGETQICIGTHALIQEGVHFHKLGLAVIDEQHRFGVMQRLALREKGQANPDVLVMTATPIPRTLTMAVYGDLDVSVIDELPPGRKPIRTHHKLGNDRQQVYENVRKLIDQGRQAYFVCPLIFDNDKLEAQAAEDLHYRLSTQVFPDLKVALLHGQLKSQEKEDIMSQFRNGQFHILVSTVVIEVGVDVPNSTVIVIEDANRFGLAQLHQLRGRVGRGDHQSFCILIADTKTEDSRRRMEILVETSDGFRIAEEDLKLRGPGDLMGIRQHGDLDLHVADLIQDTALLERSKQAAIKILSEDPELALKKNEGILRKISKRRTTEAMVVVS